MSRVVFVKLKWLRSVPASVWRSSRDRQTDGRIASWCHTCEPSLWIYVRTEPVLMMDSCKGSPVSYVKLLRVHRELLVGQVKNTQCLLDNLHMNNFICTEDREIIQRSTTKTDQVTLSRLCFNMKRPLMMVSSWCSSLTGPLLKCYFERSKRLMKETNADLCTHRCAVFWSWFRVKEKNVLRISSMFFMRHMMLILTCGRGSFIFTTVH